MRQQWDGNPYPLYTQIAISLCVVVLLLDRFASKSDGTMFGLGIGILCITIFLVPEGPQPPDD